MRRRKARKEEGAEGGGDEEGDEAGQSPLRIKIPAPKKKSLASAVEEEKGDAAEKGATVLK